MSCNYGELLKFVSIYIYIFYPVAVEDLKVLIDQLYKNDQIFCDYTVV